ncbi:MAG: hypothetical protein ACYCXW_15290 [Solirubrobacteraceae bacterium]
MTWVESKTSWHRTAVEYCDVTGQLLPPRHWRFEDGSQTIRARDPHCEELYWKYLRDRGQDR